MTETLAAAAAARNKAKVDELIAAGHDVNKRSLDGLPLETALRHKSWSVVRALLAAHARVQFCSSEAVYNSLCDAAEANEVDMIDALFFAAAAASFDFFGLLNRAAAHVKGDNGYVHLVRRLIEARAGLCRQFDGACPLHLLVRRNHAELVRLLIHATGAAMHCCDRSGATPLEVAVKLRHVEIVRLLLAAGADVMDGQLLLIAIRSHFVDVVQAFVDANKVGLNALTVAVDSGDRSIVAALLAAGCDVNAGALTAAVRRGDRSIVAALLAAGCDVNAEPPGDYHVGPLLMAAENGNVLIARTLIEAGADVNHSSWCGTPLAAAARCRSGEMVDLLLAANAQVDPDDAIAPLQVAAAVGNTAAVRTLLAAGADKKRVDRCGRTALMRAVEGGHFDAMQVLMDADVDLNVVVGNDTLLTLAVRARAPAIVRALLAAGANAQLLAPLALCADAEIAVMLIDAGADVNQGAPLQAAVHRKDVGMVRLLCAAGADVNARPLICEAACGGQWEIVMALLDSKRVDVNAVDSRGDCFFPSSTAVHFAATAKDIDTDHVVRALIDAGADVNASPTGQSPLVGSIKSSRFGAAALLIAAGADPNATDDGGTTVLELVANDAKARRLIAPLVCAGADIDCGALLTCVEGDDADAVAVLLAAGAGVSDECIRRAVLDEDISPETLSMLLSTGAAVPEDVADELSPELFDGLMAATSTAKTQIERAGFAAIRMRIVEICAALQALHVPAPQLIEIVTHACAPFAARLPYHYLWDVVVLVKHFRERQEQRAAVN